jgi:hypothetical protein
MPEFASSLTLQFLSWIACRPRTYADAMDAWRTSCPRLSIWEDALADSLIQVEGGNSLDTCRVSLTERGQMMLDRAMRPADQPDVHSPP